MKTPFFKSMCYMIFVPNLLTLETHVYFKAYSNTIGTAPCLQALQDGAEFSRKYLNNDKISINQNYGIFGTFKPQDLKFETSTLSNRMKIRFLSMVGSGTGYISRVRSESNFLIRIRIQLEIYPVPKAYPWKFLTLELCPRGFMSPNEN